MRFFSDELFRRGGSHAAHAKYVASLPCQMPESILRINRGILPDTFFVGSESAYTWMMHESHRSKQEGVLAVSKSIGAFILGGIRCHLLYFV